MLLRNALEEVRKEPLTVTEITLSEAEWLLYFGVLA